MKIGSFLFKTSFVISCGIITQHLFPNVVPNIPDDLFKSEAKPVAYAADIPTQKRELAEIPVPTQEVAPLPQKVAYITFDDGPNEHTPEILRILKENDVKATFFIMGKNVHGKEDILKQMHADGHHIAMHTMSHDNMKLYKSGNANNFISELEEEQKLLEGITGEKPMLVRPPYGSKPGVSQQHQDEMVKRELKMWDWTIDSLDWKYPKNPNQILTEVQSHISQDKEVVLMHDRKQTVEVLQQVLQTFKDKGYSFLPYDRSNHFPVNFWKNPNL
ncbi:polysaccharide deacetylase family protein [Bacillus cereus]|uniref:Peptidoglycan N-acetylglucosamine deacetylase n=1 Tax=Bacillus cereus TaxID=1396 RepID=A0A164QTQ4_BACCE|nr:polysaccharide deacetylase family protein [Bacillus cereus]KZD72170.1 peptidoglycan N-acetylglucosamine deacetylase [Bacillus cereus]